MIIPPGEEKLFLEDLPVRKLWGLGSRTEQALEELGLETIGQLAASSKDMLGKRFGKPGRQMTFQNDTNDEAALKLTLRRLSAEVGRQVRRAGLCGRTVTLTLRWEDYSTFTRQMILHNPIDRDYGSVSISVEIEKR